MPRKAANTRFATTRGRPACPAHPLAAGQQAAGLGGRLLLLEVAHCLPAALRTLIPRQRAAVLCKSGNQHHKSISHLQLMPVHLEPYPSVPQARRRACMHCSPRQTACHSSAVLPSCIYVYNLSDKYPQPHAGASSPAMHAMADAILSIIRHACRQTIHCYCLSCCQGPHHSDSGLLSPAGSAGAPPRDAASGRAH